MVNYRQRLGLNFDPSPQQVDILKAEGDSLIRALPGGGKTTILTLKIKDLLLSNSRINRICCISYTNVNVEDLELSCTKLMEPKFINKINFLTFHKFCLEYVLNPFSYLYRSQKGFRPYKKLFNYKEHGKFLLKYLREHDANEIDIEKISSLEAVYYNFKLVNADWLPVTQGLSLSTVVKYLNFLKEFKLIDFNLINLLSLKIIQENNFVARVINKSIDWIFIDEFQDVTEIQCKIIEELRKSRVDESSEIKWFMVGDPNQSIYGFAGANPRSMFDIKKIFNQLGKKKRDCEIKLKETHRCSADVFDFVKKNYNYVISRIKQSNICETLNDENFTNYLNDLELSVDLCGKKSEGKVIIRNTISSITAITDILELKFNELANEEVCCIGITKYNSIDVYKQYRSKKYNNDGEDFQIYSSIYKDFEDRYGFRYFSLFLDYLILKFSFYNNRISYSSSINKYLHSLSHLCVERFDNEIDENTLVKILVDSVQFLTPLKEDRSIFEEFIEFSERLGTSLDSYIGLSDEQRALFRITIKNKISKLEGVEEPNLKGFVNFINRGRSDKLTFEIKHIHKIKGLEYEQVILQKVEDIPYSTNVKAHNVIFHGAKDLLKVEEIYDYIQELNKLYVMLTRSKKNLYIVINPTKMPKMLNIDEYRTV